MQISVRVFGPLRDVVHEDTVLLELSPPNTAGHVYEILARRYSALNEWKPSVRLAVNLTYTGFEQELNDGDEVSLIPPVSGG